MGEAETGPGWKTVLKVSGVVLVVGALLTALPWALPRVDFEQDNLQWAGLIGLGIGVLLFYGGFRTYRKRQLIHNTPTSKVRSLAIGTAEIQGKADPLTEPLVSPLTHTPACMYELKIEERKEVRKDNFGLGSDEPHRRRTKREWKTVLTIRDHVPFCIDDGTGRVPVRADEAELSIKIQKKAKAGKRDPPPAALQQWAEEHGPSQRAMPSLPGRLGEMVEEIRAGKTRPEDIDPSEFTPKGFDPETDDPEQLDPNDVKLAGVLSKDTEGGAPDDGSGGSLLGSVGEVVEAGVDLMQKGRVSGNDRYLTSSTRNKRRFEERVLGAGEQAYVFGSARRLPDADSIENVENLVIREDETTGQFLVSDKSPRQLLDDKLVRASLLLGGGIVLLAYSTMGLFISAGLL